MISEVRNFEKIKKKLQQEQLKGYQRVATDRNTAINKDNMILLSKLVEISSGKFTSVPKNPQS